MTQRDVIDSCHIILCHRYYNTKDLLALTRRNDIIRPSNTLRCCTPAMGPSKAPGMYQNRMQCAEMPFPT